MNTNERKPEELFADCRDGNHKECLFQWPDPANPEMALTCSCSCHKKSSSITPTQLAEWRAVVEKATPSPLTVDDGDSSLIGVFGNDGTVVCYMSEIEPAGYRRGYDSDRANAELFALARTTLPRLIDEIKTKTAEIERLNACPWCGAAMERIPCDGGDELGCTSEKCVSFAIGVWCYADSLRDEVEAGQRRARAINVILVTIGGRHAIPDEVSFDALDGVECVRLEIESLRTQLREAQARIETLRETADRATARDDEASGEAERLRKLDAQSRKSGCWCDEHGHPCKACEDKQELAAELTALRDEIDRLRGINPDIDTQEVWQKELPYLFRSWLALYVENQRLRDENEQLRTRLRTRSYCRSCRCGSLPVEGWHYHTNGADKTMCAEPELAKLLTTTTTETEIKP